MLGGAISEFDTKNKRITDDLHRTLEDPSFLGGHDRGRDRKNEEYFIRRAVQPLFHKIAAPILIVPKIRNARVDSHDAIHPNANGVTGDFRDLKLGS